MKIILSEVLTIYRKIIKKYNCSDLDFNLSNGYLIQSTRNFLRYYNDKNNILFYTKKDNNIVITTWAGKNPIKLIEKYVKNIDNKIYIKNVSVEMKSKLLKLGFREYNDHERWDHETKYDDNTFPELVLDTKKTTQMSGSKYSSIREDVNRFNKQYNIKVESLINIDFPIIKTLFNEWVENMNTRNNIDKKQLTESTKVLCTSKFGIINYIVKDLSNNKIIGWMNFSESSKKCLSFNVLVNDFSYYNLYRIMMIEACKIALNIGYKYLNIQGSEDEGQYTSKLRLKPEIEINKIHMVLN